MISDSRIPQSISHYAVDFLFAPSPLRSKCLVDFPHFLTIKDVFSLAFYSFFLINRGSKNPTER